MMNTGLIRKNYPPIHVGGGFTRFQNIGLMDCIGLFVFLFNIRTGIKSKFKFGFVITNNVLWTIFHIKPSQKNEAVVLQCQKQMRPSISNDILNLCCGKRTNNTYQLLNIRLVHQYTVLCVVINIFYVTTIYNNLHNCK